jgi:hypothetical protein
MFLEMCEGALEIDGKLQRLWSTEGGRDPGNFDSFLFPTDRIHHFVDIFRMFTSHSATNEI